MQPPSAEHWFGTDNTGRDILSRVIFGTRNTLMLGLVGVHHRRPARRRCSASSPPSTAALDGWIMRLVDVMLAFPAILIGLAVAAIFGAGPHRRRDRAGRGHRARRGAGGARRGGRRDGPGIHGGRPRRRRLATATLIWRYLTLNCISTIFVFLTLRFGQIILIGSALGFLGMGAQPPTAELGMMAAQGRDFLFMAPHIATIPSFAIFVIVLAANLLGDALRDVLDPRLQTMIRPALVRRIGVWHAPGRRRRRP